MTRSLCEASTLENVRRTRRALRGSPLLWLAVLAGWLGAPYGSWRLGAALAIVLGDALGDSEAVRALGVGCALSAAAAGAAVGAGTPPPRAFGLQLVTAPIGRAVLVVAAALPTIVGSGLLVAPAVVAGMMGYATHAEAISPDPAAALASLAGLAVVGALVVESGAALRRDAILGAGSLAAAAVTGLALERSLERALAGHTAPALLAPACVAVLPCAVSWVALRARRPVVRCHASTTAIPRRLLAGRRRAAVFGATGILVRTADLRAALAAAAGFGVCGIALGVALAAPLAAAVVLGGGAAALTAAIVPLSVRGRIDSAAWTWRAAGRMELALGWAVAALGLTLLAVAPVLVVGAARPAGFGAVGYVLSLTWFCWVAALMAGAMVPRRSSRLGDDAASLAALLAVAGALGVAVSAAGPRLEGIGLPPPMVVSLLALVTGAAAVGSVAAAWGHR